MRSWRELLLLALVACGGEPVRAEKDPACPEDSVLDWTNFGEPFVRSWCTGCHSSALDGDDRQGAPPGLDFDALANVQAHLDAIRREVVREQTMPPGGGPDAEARALFDEWLACGAPGKDDFDPPEPGDTAPPAQAPGCDRVGRWVLSGATCNGADATATWVARFPVTELTVAEEGDTCAITYRVADAGCEEVQVWRSDLAPPASTFEFLGTVSCEPVGCAWAAQPDDVCVVLADAATQTVNVTELATGELALGPLAPPDLAGFCTALGLVFVRVSP